jgi:hypothetical protein
MKKALILSYKYVESAPRILKEIDWLESDGWNVDTVGLGTFERSKGNHFELSSSSTLSRFLAYLNPIKKSRFSFLIGRHLSVITPELLRSYDLLIIHDLTLLPSEVLQIEISRRKGAGVQIDFHEDHLDSLARNLLESIIFDGYRKWELENLKEGTRPFVERMSFTAVSARISTRFSDFLGVKVFTVRNAPRFRQLQPSAVNQNLIQLVHHGVGAPHRGIEASILALRGLGPTFELHLLLLSSRLFLVRIKLLILFLGLKERVFIHPPVPTPEISSFINEFDVALMVIPPVTVNELHAMPNKFFESVQACLAIVTGPNPDLAAEVRDRELGVVAAGWCWKDILLSVKAVPKEDWFNYKLNASKNALRYTATIDQSNFLGAIAETTNQEV